MRNIQTGLILAACVYAVSAESIAAPDTKQKTPEEAAITRELTLTAHYLHLPVKGNEGKRDPRANVALMIDGTAVREFSIGLAEKPDWYAHLDVGAWKGKQATLRVTKLQTGSKALDLVVQADTIWAADQVYREPLRPRYHFSSQRGWLNDPNGMVYSQGEYHLYYQHNPYGWPWGNMSWGHAVSTDMVHWTELPIALYPRGRADMAFSGSAVVDKDNTSGWKQGTNDLIVVAYTSTGRGECLAYSHDRGRTFQEPEGNPAVRHDGRDPRLLWHAATRMWVMAIFDQEGDKEETDKSQRGGIAFYISPDFKKWTRTSRIKGFHECPDLLELPVDGNSAKTLWLIHGASSDYMLGQFDGKAFAPSTPKLPGNQGRGFYAAQTFSHAPKVRCIQIGWLRVPSPDMPFNQLMSLPQELSLRTTPEGPRLVRTPVPELASLRGAACDVAGLATFRAEQIEVRAEFGSEDADLVSIKVRGASISYDTKTQELSVLGRKVPAPMQNGKQRLAIYVDRTTIEVFASDGLIYVPLAFTPAAADQTVSAQVSGGKGKLGALQVYPLASAWGRD